MRLYEIRADYDKDTIVIYQAYSELIALNAVKNGSFSVPFSFNRMTWLKTSFLWMMERSNYARKSGQEYILAIRIKRSAWEYALSKGVLTDPDHRVYKDRDIWRQEFDNALVHIQWDPDYTIKGGKRHERCIQVGISRLLIKEYNEEWIVDIKDYTSLAKKIYNLRLKGNYDQAKKLLPIEKFYALPNDLKKKIGMN